jgi:HAD superfamily hydrolase (TIGR01509 family)
MTDVRLICFDLGGVVIRICRSWAEGCRAAGVHHDPVVESPEYAPSLALCCRAHHKGEMDAETFASDVAALLPGVYDAQQILAIHRAWLLEEYDGVADLVDAIHVAGVETAVLSNTNDAHWPRLKEYPAVQKIKRLFASHLLGAVKPDPEAFRAVERCSGRAADQILFFDDAAVNVDAARSLGWRAARIDPSRPTRPQMEAVLGEHGVLD